MDFKPLILREHTNGLKLIISLVDKIRPGRLESSRFAVERLTDLINCIRQDKECKEILAGQLVSLLRNTSSTALLTQSGIYASGGIFSDLSQKLKHSLLPPLRNYQEMGDVITAIFHKPWDHKWVTEVPDSLWIQLADELGLSLKIYPSGAEMHEILNSILILSHRVVVLGLDPIMVSKIPGIGDLDSPFFKQNQELGTYIEILRMKQDSPLPETAQYLNILEIFDQCKQSLSYVKVNRNTIGASMGLTYLTHRLNQHINRITKLMLVLHEKSNEQKVVSISLFKEMVLHQNTKNNLLSHFSANIGLLAYQVTEHAAKTGEHYISSNRKEYFDFFKYSLGGGFIVGFMACIKVGITMLHLPPLNEALLNGFNYGIGFIIIHLCGFTLATKQPAMTASTLAGSLEGHTNDNVGISNLAQQIVKISRTQFISFAGNLMMVFPVSWLLSRLFFELTGNHIAGIEKSQHMIAELHPFYSPSIWYAAIAGFLLYTAGLISGYFDNKTVFNSIPERIYQLRSLKFLSVSRRRKLANYMGDNLGSLAGNFILGMLLASMKFFGFILGLPLDVRHVTFVTGNFGLSLEGLENTIGTETLIFTLLAIIIVGFVNFIVSFGMAIFTAIRARSVKFKQTWKLINLLIAYLFTYPFDFFFPPRTDRVINVVDDENTN